MARNVYRIGALAFTSKDKIRRHFGAIRQKYLPGQTIEDATDAQAVLDLLQGHVDREQKIGPGVRRVYVDYAPDHPHSTCFWIERVDGHPPTDFGVPACIDNIGRLNRQSLRECIRPQIEAFRASKIEESAQTFTSDLSGESFPISELHIDHRDTTFEEIVQSFANTESLSIESDLLTISVDACSGPRWRDPQIAARFFEFHARFPLQMITRNENLSLKKRLDNARIRGQVERP